MTAPAPQTIADTRTASPGAASVIRCSASVGVRPSRIQAVVAANRRRRIRSSSGTATARKTTSADPLRSRSCRVSAGFNTIGAANTRKAKTIPPPARLTATAAQIHRWKIAYRNGSRGGIAERSVLEHDVPL